MKIKVLVALPLFDLRQAMPVYPDMRKLQENLTRAILRLSEMRYRESTRKCLYQLKVNFPIPLAERALRPLDMNLI